MKKKLTYRQQQFLEQFLDLYREMCQPMHYVTIAERLGVGKITAYEMLRLLEERHLVSAEYRTEPNQHGPGRPNVLFYPTQESEYLLKALVGNSANIEDWQKCKEEILRKLRKGQVDGYEDLINDLLVRIPERKTPIIFVTELITATILSMAAIKDAPEVRSILEQITRIGVPEGFGLGIFSGINLFLSALERANRNTTRILLSHINHYENALAQLNEESKNLLSEYTREVLRILLT